MPAWTLALVLLSNPAAPQSQLSLFRGASLPGQPIRYWAVEDAVLDSSKQDGNFGGEAYIGGGPGKTMLIKFGDLRRALGPNKKIVRASILFTLTGGNPAPATKIAEILVPWGEGPTQVVTYAAPPSSIEAPTWAATWKHRRSGQDAIPWQQPGATGVGDVKTIAEARAASPDIDHVRIEGLEGALQRQYDRPHKSHGIALNFSAPIEFASSQSKNLSSRPVLELTIEENPRRPGPDLAVVRIVRTPEYPRYDASGSPLKVMQDGVEVILPSEPSNFRAKHWPANGEEVTYTAIIKNLGDAPSAGHFARWIIRERPGSSIESEKVLAPGEETALSLTSSYRNIHADHRLQPIALEIEPKGQDANPSNDELTIHEGALAVGLKLAPDAAQAIAVRGLLGETTPEGFSQALIRLWNDTIFSQSRFSFAPNGVLERLRLQRFEVGEGALSDPNLDVEISASTADLQDPQRFLKSFGRRLGLPDLEATSFDSNSKTISIGGLVLERGSTDLHPGIMGGGDTRNEGFVPSALVLPHEPTTSPIFDVLPIESTDLLSATSAAALNTALGHRRGFMPEALLNLPPTLVVRIRDQADNPVRSAIVEVFPMAGGLVRGAQPIATLTTGPEGSIVLPARPSLAPEGYKTPLGVELKPNPFGAVDPSGANGVILLKVNVGGSTDFGFIKAWQIVDAYRRYPIPAPIVDLRVSVGGDVDRTENLAKNRIVTDSSNMLPAKLAVLLDEDNSTSLELPGQKDAWIEIDLGRDRAFGEISLASSGTFWDRFAITAYATSQTPIEAKPMTKEASWTWTYANRSVGEGNGTRSVLYRTPGIRARFIRIVRLTDGPPGSLAEIKVHPLKGP